MDVDTAVHTLEELRAEYLSVELRLMVEHDEDPLLHSRRAHENVEYHAELLSELIALFRFTQEELALEE
jgi:hypothetical protein